MICKGLVPFLSSRRKAFNTPKIVTCLSEASEEPAQSLWSPCIAWVPQLGCGEAGTGQICLWGGGSEEAEHSPRHTAGARVCTANMIQHIPTWVCNEFPLWLLLTSLNEYGRHGEGREGGKLALCSPYVGRGLGGEVTPRGTGTLPVSFRGECVF